MAHIVGDLEAIGDLSLAEIKNLDLTLPAEPRLLAIRRVTRLSDP